MIIGKCDFCGKEVNELDLLKNSIGMLKGVEVPMSNKYDYFDICKTCYRMLMNKFRENYCHLRPDILDDYETTETKETDDD